MQVSAQSPAEVTRAKDWLLSKIQNDGSITGELSALANPSQVRGEVARALFEVQAPSASLLAALQQLADRNSEYLARLIMAQGAAQSTADLSEILNRQNADGGFGNAPGYASTVLDTALVLLARKAVGEAANSSSERAVGFLVSKQLPNGSFGEALAPRKVIATALVQEALTAYASAHPQQGASVKARQWLLAEQVEGVYGDVLSNAHGLLALARHPDVSASERLLAKLKQSQAADGSFAGGDPYVTAVALRALLAAGNAPPPPSTGNLRAKVVDGSSAQALLGVEVQLTGAGSATQTTTADGRVFFSSLAPGSYQVRAQKVGYQTRTVTAVVVAGETTDLAELPLLPADVGPTVRGVVRAASSGQVLAGVTVSLSGAASGSTQSDAQGRFVLNHLATGTSTITLSKTGYRTHAQQLVLVANTVYQFSPSLYAENETAPTEASMRGALLNASNQQAIAGGVVQVGTQSASSSSNGQFNLAGLATGTVSGTIAAEGFTSVQFTVVLAPGANDVGNILLQPSTAPTTLTLRGVVRSTASGNPSIAGANIRVQAAPQQALSAPDGRYELAGVTSLSVTLQVSAAGFLSRTLSVNAPQFGTSTLDLELSPAVAGGVAFEVVNTPQPSFDPFAEVLVGSEIRNETTQAVDAQFTLAIQDSQGQTVIEVPMVQLVLGQNPNDAFRSIPAGGRIPVAIKWYPGNAVAGSYLGVLRAYGRNGALLAERGTGFVINAKRQIGGALTLSPPMTLLQSTTPVQLSASIMNQGNLPIPAGPYELIVRMEVPESILGGSTAELSTHYNGQLFTAIARDMVRDPAGNLFTLQGASIYRTLPNGTTSLWLQIPSDPVCFSASWSSLEVLGVNQILIGGSKCVMRVNADLSTAMTRIGGIGSERIAASDTGEIYLMDNQGVSQLLGDQNTVRLIGRGLAGPNRVRRRGNGELLIANSDAGTIARYQNGRLQEWVTGINGAKGLALAANENAFVLDTMARSLVKVVPAGTKTTIATGFNTPSDVLVRADQSLLVLDSGTREIVKVTEGVGKEPWLQGMVLNAQGMAFGPSGLLYLANKGGNVVRQELDGRRTSYSANFVDDVAVSADGSAYLTHGNALKRLQSDGNMATLWTESGGLATRVTVSATDDIYFSTRFEIRRYQSTNVAEVVARSFIEQAYDLALDAAGGLVVVNNASLVRVPATMAPIELQTGSDLFRAAHVMADGTIYSSGWSKILKRAPDGQVTQVVATGSSYIESVYGHDNGDVYFLEFNQPLRKVNSSGVVSVVYARSSLIAYAGSASAHHVLDSSGRIWRFVEGNPAPSAHLALVSGASNMNVGADGKLYVVANNRIVQVDGTSGAQQTLITAPATRNFQSAVMLSDGRLAALDRGIRALWYYNDQAQEVDNLAGFDAPADLAWFDGRLWLTDSNRLLSVSPSNPRVRQEGMLGGTSIKLAANQQRLLLAYAAGIYRWNNGAAELLHSSRRNAVVSALALSEAGALAFATEANELYRLNAALSVTRYQPSLEQAVGLAEDNQGRIYLGTGKGLWRMQADGLDGELMHAGEARYPALDGDGRVLICSALALSRFDPQSLQLSSLANTPCVAPLADGAGVIYSDASNRLSRREGNNLTVLSSGLGTPTDIAYAQGSLWVVDRLNNSIGRVGPDGLELVSTGVSSPQLIARMENDDLVVFNQAKQIYSIKAGVLAAGLPTASLFVTASKTAVGGPNPEDLYFLSPAPVGIDRVRAGAPVIPIPAGTVVHRVEQMLPLLNAGDAPLQQSFGLFSATQGGDYSVEMRSLSAGVGGMLQSVLHVGPMAEGTISVDDARVAPTEAVVRAAVDLRGLDYTKIARADVLATQALPIASGEYVISFGMDAQGRAVFSRGNSIQRITFGGSAPTSEVLANERVDSRGRLPIDAAGNIYFGQEKALKRLNAQGAVSVLRSYPSDVSSIDQISNGRLIVGTRANGLFSVNPDGSDSRLLASTSAGFSITTDALDNIYMQSELLKPHPTIAGRFVNPIFKVTLDGTVTPLLEAPRFENEGANIAGDCADNLLITATSWPEIGQDSEEHIVAQYRGRSGATGAVLNSLLINNFYNDLDTMIFDRFQSALLLWNHGISSSSNEAILRIPITCGAITTRLVAVVPANQPAGAFDPAPSEQTVQADGSRKLLWTLTDLGSITHRVRLQTQLKDLRLGERRALFREAYLEFKNAFAPTQDIRLPLSIPMMEVENIIEGELSVSAASYSQNADVGITQTLLNSDSQTVSGELVMEVIDSSGIRVRELLRESINLAGGASLSRTPAFNTGQTIAGAYRVRTRLLSAQGPLLAEWLKDVLINAGNGTPVQVETQVVPEQVEYDASQKAVFNLRVKNLATNIVLENLSAKLTVKKPDGSELAQLNAAPFNLAPSAQHSYQQSLQLAQAAAGNYMLLQEVRSASGALLATASGSFRVRANGVSLDGLSGTLVATPAALEAGTNTRLDVRLNNAGNTALSSVPIELVVMDRSLERNFAQWQSIRDIAVGGSGTSFSETWESFGAAPGVYLAVLRAGPEGAQRVLAEFAITVTAPTISFSIEQAIERDTRLLVLIACPNDANEASCISARKNFLATHLASLGVDHAIVSTPENFASWFRSGRYNTFWLASSARGLRGRPPLITNSLLRSGFENDEDASTLASEMLEAVRRGASLWVDGPHHPLHFELMPALGVNHLGAGNSNPTVQLLAGVYQPSSFVAVGASGRYQATTATVLAQFGDNSPAVFSNNFGAGKSLVMGFDLLATMASQNPLSSTLSSAFDRSLLHLLPPLPLDYVAGDYFPLVTQVSNQHASPVNTIVRSTQSPEVGLWRWLPGAGAAVGSQVTWQQELAPLVPKRFEVDLRLPLALVDESAVANSRTRVSSMRAGSMVVPFAEPSYEIEVLHASTLMPELRSRIINLPLADSNDLAARERALEALDAAWANHDARPGLAFKEYQRLQQALYDIAALSTEPERQDARNMAREAQHRWYAALPACTSTPALASVPEHELHWVGAHHGLEVRGGGPSNDAIYWETAIGPNLLQATGPSFGQHNWISGKRYQLEFAIAPNGSGTLLVKDGATTVLNQSYDGSSLPLKFGNGVQWIVRSIDQSDASLQVMVGSINGVAVNDTITHPASAGAHRLTRTYFAPPTGQGLRLAGEIIFTFTGSNPPLGNALSLRVQPGFLSCRPPFATGQN
jgi:hypothetical protein